MEIRKAFVFSLYWLALLSLVGLVCASIQAVLEWPLKTSVTLRTEKMIPKTGNTAYARLPLPVSEVRSGYLLEDGRSIGILSTFVDDVKTLGAGRYKVKEGKLYFSSSDGSDPRRNGRSYHFVFPKAVPDIFFWWLFTSTIAALATALLTDLNYARQAAEQIAVLFGDYKQSVDQASIGETSKNESCHIRP
jgi:hypothetical protein